MERLVEAPKLFRRHGFVQALSNKYLLLTCADLEAVSLVGVGFAKLKRMLDGLWIYIVFQPN